MIFVPRCPVSTATREWLETSTLWLIEQFGQTTVKSAEIVTPTKEFFPDPYDGSPASLERLFERICRFMRIDRTRLVLGVYEGTRSAAKPIRALFSDGYTSGTRGVFLGRNEDGVLVLAIDKAQLRDPASLVAVMAHELAHVHLLADGRLTGEEQDHEKLADLLTVFLGMGVFTATAAFQFRQWKGEDRHEYWGVRRLGYLSEEEFGYALALVAWLRSERKARWANYLPTGAYTFFTQGVRFLRRFPPRGVCRQ